MKNVKSGWGIKLKHLVSNSVTQARIAKWLDSATSVTKNPTWTERRQAIEFGGHTYLVSNGQVFQCAHCGHYDPEWKSTEVLNWFEENFNKKPIEIEITCTVATPDGS